MRKRMPAFFPARLSQWVRLLPMFAHAEGDGYIPIVLNSPTAAAAANLLGTTSIAAIGSTTTLLLVGSFQAQTEAIMGTWGRALSVTCDGAATSTVTLTGRDYLNQRMVETITLAGAATINGKKAFRYLDSVSWTATAARSITVGTTNLLGLTYKAIALKDELRDGVLVTGGTFVAGGANTLVQTATTADPRGTYAPSSAPDGVAVLSLRVLADGSNGHGNAQFFA